ncbi:uncharacterized protein LOC130992340 isoform X2 [Salvia miltiorrhiza]|uniref:uncharacterized protein LOC130992340 isoform X2 n=1 Tax=Salvia miltiorrhiza TaxID=226208 RepID=UPI0025ACDA2C|nr:uncharacterized protein LOC130992340 isoform X2 [Salvia miltiorrhiza]
MFRRLAVRLRTLAPPRSASKIAQFSVGSSTPSENVVRSLPVFSRHFSSESGNVPKKVEDIVPIATGHEREELEAELEGRDILEINHPSGPFGTKRERERVGMMGRTLNSAIRCVQTVAECPHLTKLSLHAPKSVEVEFDNGSAYNLSAEYLRVYSPAVDSKIRSVGGEKVIAGRRDVGIMSAEPVGNYGVRDLHMGLLLLSW